jgi:23S rRNA (cytidine1920-2'-O)/16S rRNA (cytidine1409-2'-O)-methyltransferase
LRAALSAFGIRPAGWVCADFGANIGGFTDCLLQDGAERVYAVDTGYGELAWRLRQDDRVVVMERTNALHTDCPAPGGVDLVTIDVAFTPQRLIIPAAASWLGEGGRIVSLIKPHYEAAKLPGRRPKPRRRPLPDAEAQAIARGVLDELAERGFPARSLIDSPLRGKGGGLELLALFAPGGRP